MALENLTPEERAAIIAEVKADMKAEEAAALPAVELPPLPPNVTVAPIPEPFDVQKFMAEQAEENRKLRLQLDAMNRKLSGIAAADNAETIRTCNCCGMVVEEGKCERHPTETVNVTLVSGIKIAGEAYRPGMILRRE